jgi:glycerophosphoryl diester phosphodiesterase
MQMADKIPPEIFLEIRRVASAEWPDSPEMQQYMVDAEATAYRKLAKLDFGGALEQKAAILKEAHEYYQSWQDIVSFVSEEVDAFNTLAAFAPEDVPVGFVTEQKRKARVEHDWFASQLEDVQQAVEAYRYVQRTRAKVGPIRDLLVRMESIIGSECYNANIQNYSAWGVWEGEGRAFRYPVTYIRNGQEEKRKARTDDLEPEALITGHYKFGANELSIHRALVRIIDMLRNDYDLKIPGDEDRA